MPTKSFSYVLLSVGVKRSAKEWKSLGKKMSEQASEQDGANKRERWHEQNEPKKKWKV